MKTLGKSAGIALHLAHGEPSNKLLDRADLALYQAPHSGRNCVKVYDAAEQNPSRGDLTGLPPGLFVHRQPVAHAGLRAQQARAGRVGFEFVAQVRQVHAKVVSFLDGDKMAHLRQFASLHASTTDSAILDQNRDHLKALTDRDRQSLETLQSHPLLRDCQNLITKMLAENLKLEQEAWAFSTLWPGTGGGVSSACRVAPLGLYLPGSILDEDAMG